MLLSPLNVQDSPPTAENSPALNVKGAVVKTPSLRVNGVSPISWDRELRAVCRVCVRSHVP